MEFIGSHATTIEICVAPAAFLRGAHCWRPIRTNGWKWEKQPRRKNAQFAECLEILLPPCLVLGLAVFTSFLAPGSQSQSVPSSWGDLLTIDDDQRQSNREQPCALADDDDDDDDNAARSVSQVQLSQLIRLLPDSSSSSKPPKKIAEVWTLCTAFHNNLFIHIFVFNTYSLV